MSLLRTFCITSLNLFAFAQSGNILQAAEPEENVSSTNRSKDSSLFSSNDNPLLVDMGVYGAMNAGLFHSLLPSVGLSVRAQKGVHGSELDLSMLPYDPDDVDAGLAYKTSLSYLYHIRGSGVYFGGGLGWINNRHFSAPIAVTCVGFQFSSRIPHEMRFTGFVDGGVTTLVRRRPQEVVFTLVPTARVGIGLSF